MLQSDTCLIAQTYGVSQPYSQVQLPIFGSSFFSSFGVTLFSCSFWQVLWIWNFFLKEETKLIITLYLSLHLFSAVIYQSFMTFPSSLSLLSDLSNTHTLHFCISAFLQIFHLKWRASANVSLCNVEVSRMCHKTFTRSPNCSLTLFFFFFFFYLVSFWKT